MSRLTRRDAEGIWVKENGDFETHLHHYDECYAAAEKLAHYEDMEEQGRLIELPCAVGDTVWCIYEKKIYKGKVTVIKPFIVEKGKLLYINMNVSFEMKDPFYGDGRILTHEMYGRYLENVFLTKEEAEAKLKELKGDKE